jgi:hypothetical protein
MSGKKLPLPIIDVNHVMPKNSDDCKCAPNVSFDNGSCMTLEILIDLSNAYNIHCGENNKPDDKIKIYDGMELLHPDEYKRY